MEKREADYHSLTKDLDVAPKKLKVGETDKKPNFIDFKSYEFLDDAKCKSEKHFSKFFIPKIKASNFMVRQPGKADGNFLSWSNNTINIPSPPGEIANSVGEVSGTQSNFTHTEGNFTKILNDSSTKSVHYGEKTFSPDDLHHFEHFKEAIELLIIKVILNFNFKINSLKLKLTWPRISMTDRNS